MRFTLALLIALASCLVVARCDDSTPSDSTPSDSTPSDSTPSDSTPSDSTPSDSTPSDSTPSDSTPSDSTPSDSTPSDSTPSDSSSGSDTTEITEEQRLQLLEILRRLKERNQGGRRVVVIRRPRIGVVVNRRPVLVKRVVRRG
ncbi:hypothetical protein KR093_005910 [Drosophila rubida]|uniref:Uncharacterized protein n=1 Tax=Drosophila rubida TaxID=30044 RepID=A0AAD4K151_9MUSC|nr:hypothetical protein KR093_005910 [Drosophila rubida]